VSYDQLRVLSCSRLHLAFSKYLLTCCVTQRPDIIMLHFSWWLIIYFILVNSSSEKTGSIFDVVVLCRLVLLYTCYCVNYTAFYIYFLYLLLLLSIFCCINFMVRHFCFAFCQFCSFPFLFPVYLLDFMLFSTTCHNSFVLLLVILVFLYLPPLRVFVSGSWVYEGVYISNLYLRSCI
jgi:hypothetical protein